MTSRTVEQIRLEALHESQEATIQKLYWKIRELETTISEQAGILDAAHRTIAASQKAAATVLVQATYSNDTSYHSTLRLVRMLCDEVVALRKEVGDLRWYARNTKQT